MKALTTLLLPLLTATVLAQPAHAGSDDAMSAAAMRSMTRQLAFDPARFFPDAIVEPIITIRYTGDDYGFPVYSIAVAKGCTSLEVSTERESCGSRIVARMVRAPDPAPKGSEPTRRRGIGAAVFNHIHERNPGNEKELREAIQSYGLEWLEADIRQCPAAIKHLESARRISFFAEPAFPDPSSTSIVLHADKIDFAFGEYNTRSRYVGYAKRGNPGEWADQFAASLEGCWKPAEAMAPWLLSRPAEPEIATSH